jgi:hypothetical protein
MPFGSPVHHPLPAPAGAAQQQQQQQQMTQQPPATAAQSTHGPAPAAAAGLPVGASTPMQGAAASGAGAMDGLPAGNASSSLVTLQVAGGDSSGAGCSAMQAGATASSCGGSSSSSSNGGAAADTTNAAAASTAAAPTPAPTQVSMSVRIITYTHGSPPAYAPSVPRRPVGDLELHSPLNIAAHMHIDRLCTVDHPTAANLAKYASRLNSAC